MVAGRSDGWAVHRSAQTARAAHRGRAAGHGGSTEAPLQAPFEAPLEAPFEARRYACSPLHGAELRHCRGVGALRFEHAYYLLLTTYYLLLTTYYFEHASARLTTKTRTSWKMMKSTWYRGSVGVV